MSGKIRVTRNVLVGGQKAVRPRRAARFAIVTLLLPLFAACKQENTYQPPPPPRVDVAHPVRQPVSRYFELTGNTQAVQTVDLEARVQGFIEAISYADGDRVVKGTPLFTIQQNTYQAQVEQAKATLASQQATLDNAQSEYYRQSTLGKQEFASQARVQDAKTKVDKAAADVSSARASLDLANINLGYTKVLAPFDGIVTHHLVDVGTLVGVAGPTKLATITQVDPLYAYFSVSEAQVLQIKRQLAKSGRKLTDMHVVPVEIGLQSEEGYPHAGTLDYVSPNVDPSTGTLLLRGLFDNKARALMPGLFVRVRVPVGRDAAALLVPDSAIGTSQEGSYVLVVGADNVVAQRNVKRAELDGSLRVIDAGLGPADWVVVNGLQRAVPGATVNPRQIDLASAGPPAGGNPPTKP